VAAQVAQILPHTQARILEFGAGTGRLAQSLLAELDRLGVPVESYGIVEVSADLRDRQAAVLPDKRFSWLDQPPPGFSGVIIANEVLDVMPVRLFIKRGGRVLERGVGLADGRLAFANRDAPPDLRAAVVGIEAAHGILPDDYLSELGLIARAWMRSMSDWLAHGAALLVDYGFPSAEYYHPQRLMGTLMCHYRQHAHDDVFWLPGLNDLTAHVDFTALADEAHAAGLDVLGYTSQAHFLVNCGLLDLLQAEHTPRRSAEVQRLLSEAEMGELFKVLAVGRGLDLPLLGFTQGDRLHTL
jgi:SAM-dependent MidA family methyltransferase